MAALAAAELAAVLFVAFWATACFYLVVYWFLVPTPYHTYKLYFNYTEANLAGISSLSYGATAAVGGQGGANYQSLLLTHHLDSLHRSRERQTDMQTFKSQVDQLQRQQSGSLDRLHENMEQRIGRVSQDLYSTLDSKLEPLSQQVQDMSSKMELLLEELRQQRQEMRKEPDPEEPKLQFHPEDGRAQHKSFETPTTHNEPGSISTSPPKRNDQKDSADVKTERPRQEQVPIRKAPSGKNNSKNTETIEETGGQRMVGEDEDEIPINVADAGAMGTSSSSSSSWLYSMSGSLFGSENEEYARTKEEPSDNYLKSVETELKIFERSLDTMREARHKDSWRQLPSDTVRIRSARDGWRPVNDKEASLFEQGEVSRILSRGQAYEVNIVMTLPLSSRNRNVGSFMLLTELIAPDDETLATCERPLSVPFEPRFVYMVRTVLFAPLYLIGWWEETVTLRATCFKGYTERFAQPVAAIKATLSSPEVDVSAAEMEVRAQLSGLAYWLHVWFFTSMVAFFLFFVPTIFLFLALVLVYVFGVETFVPYRSLLTENYAPPVNHGEDEN